MKTDIINIKNVKVMVVTRDNCKDCDELIERLRKFQKVITYMELVIYNISNSNSSNIQSKIPFKVLITPALFINGRLKHYGNISSEKIKKIIIQ